MNKFMMFIVYLFKFTMLLWPMLILPIIVISCTYPYKSSKVYKDYKVAKVFKGCTIPVVVQYELDFGKLRSEVVCGKCRVEFENGERASVCAPVFEGDLIRREVRRGK